MKYQSPFWLFLICANLTIVSCQNLEKKKWDEGMDMDIKQIMDEYHAAGVAVGIVDNGKLHFSKGYGYRDYARKLPVDPNTLFGIGSVTKSFTATLLGILEDQGSLSLSDKPRLHIPKLKFYHPNMDSIIQIRHLLTHSTGISGLMSGSTSILFKSDNMEDLVPRLQHLRPTAAVGEQFIYNNMIYAIAGLITEKVTGLTWETNLEQLIFSPLKMHETVAGAQKATENTNFSLGYAVNEELPIEVLLEDIPTRAPAGDIYSSINDLSKWVITWLDSGKFENEQVLPTDYVAEAISALQEMPNGRDSTQAMYYGYGWFNQNYKGHFQVGHSGSISGYASNVVFFPEDQIGIIVLANQSNSNITYAITDLIIERFMGLEITEEERPPLRFSTIPIIDPNVKTIIQEEAPPTRNLKEFVGKYHHPGFGNIEISWTDSTLFAQMPFTTFRLEHLRQNTFQGQFAEAIPLLMGPFLQFDFQDQEDQIQGVLVNLDSEPILFEHNK